ncbi:MAG: hypothetical protein DCE92_08885 [Alphaproteobacteria bacterium]|nr:MAG: hypothetical protein DCE92_08885 [Alphaproteobacteria bacterium]
MTEPTEAEINALDITDAEAAQINAISHPLLADPAPDANDDLVQIDSTVDGTVFITINRPAKKNAFDAATIAALNEAFETLHGADNVRAVFIRGAGGTFSAGADLQWMADAAGWTEGDNRDDAMGLARMLKALHDIPALTVAVVEGAAMGGGAGIVEFISMLTDSLTLNAPGAMGETKRLVRDVAGQKIDSGLLEETAKRIARARVSEEGQEGVRAFLEKRKPRWAE